MSEAAELHSQKPHPGLSPEELRVHLSLHVVAETQITTADPPCTGEAYRRLVAAGATPHDAIHQICAVVAQEAFVAMQQGQAFDGARYAKALSALSAGARVPVPREI